MISSVPRHATGTQASEQLACWTCLPPQDFHSIYDTPSVRDKEGEEWKQYLQAAVLFLVLSPNGNHQQDMLFRVAEYKKLEELPAYKVSSDPCPSIAGEACKTHDNGCAAVSQQCGLIYRVAGVQYHLVDVPYRVDLAVPHHHHAFRGPPWQMLVKLFTTPEIIGYPVENQETLESDPCLAAGGPELLAK